MIESVLGSLCSRGITVAQEGSTFHFDLEVSDFVSDNPERNADNTSPNAEEAFSILSRPLPVSKGGIEQAADELLDLGIGDGGGGWVIIRSGPLGAYAKSRVTKGVWVGAYWTAADEDKVVDVTGELKLAHKHQQLLSPRDILGAGNSFLGGLAAGLELSDGNVLEGQRKCKVLGLFQLRHSLTTSAFVCIGLFIIYYRTRRASKNF